MWLHTWFPRRDPNLPVSQRMEQPITSRSSPAPTGLMCPPSLCQESLAVFPSYSHLRVTSSPWPFSKLYLPPQVSSLFFHSTYDVVLVNIISFCLFPLIWLLICFPPLETQSPVGRDPHILAGRRSQEADGEPTGKNTNIRRVSCLIQVQDEG